MPCRTLAFVLVTVLIFGLLLTASVAGQEMLLWDNYPAGVADATFNMSSERNTQVVEATWAADDVDLAGMAVEGMALSRLVWIGGRHPGYEYAGADVIFLDDQFNTLVELTGVSYSFVDLDPDPNPASYVQTYQGEIVFEEPIPLADLGEHFYVGVRLVGAGYLQGRNYFVISSHDASLRGRTEGHVLGAIFGAPSWRPASDVWYGGPAPGINFEFAFRLYAGSNAACTGDFDGNGRVDLADMTILLSNFGRQGDAGPNDGDLDGDGDVDLSDVAAFLQYYGQTCW